MGSEVTSPCQSKSRTVVFKEFQFERRFPNDTGISFILSSRPDKPFSRSLRLQNEELNGDEVAAWTFTKAILFEASPSSPDAMVGMWLPRIGLRPTGVCSMSLPLTLERKPFSNFQLEAWANSSSFGIEAPGGQTPFTRPWNELLPSSKSSKRRSRLLTISVRSVPVKSHWL